LDTLHLEHDGLNVITMEEYLNREAMNGMLVNKTSGVAVFPPGNRTKWDGEDLMPLWQYLRETTDVRKWRPMNCIAAFPASPDPKHSKRLRDAFQTAVANDKQGENITYPVPVEAAVVHRFREILAGREELCMYDEEMQASNTVHFMCNHQERARLLTHFYSFLFFEDWKQDLWAKRFVRDHIRYRDELICAAARVVEAVRDRAKGRNPGSNTDGEYDSFHIRRGDFQYKKTRIEAEDILNNVKDLLGETGTTIYIATDERNKDFFKPISSKYDIVFLDDFKHLIPDLNTNFYGMLDQLIASKGRKFFGTYWSTLTGYIMRMRGYMSAERNVEDFMKGELKDSFYFVPVRRIYEMSSYIPVKKPFYAREFPVSWRDIDH